MIECHFGFALNYCIQLAEYFFSQSLLPAKSIFSLLYDLSLEDEGLNIPKQSDMHL